MDWPVSASPFFVACSLQTPYFFISSICLNTFKNATIKNMKISTYSKNTLAFMLVVIGILIGVTLSVMSTWADFEAAFYGFAKQAKSPLPGLSCPILMTSNESQTITIKITNQTSEKISPSVKMERSTPLAPDTTFEFIELAPNESRSFTWTIGPENIDLGQFIFAKVLVYSAYPMPDQENTCGMFILPIRGSGTWILIITSIISILSLISGAYLLYKSDIPVKQTRSAIFLAAVVLLNLAVSFTGLWIQSIGLLAITTLMVFIIFSLQLRQNT